MSEKKISKESQTTRLFANDNQHIQRKVKALRFDDTRFASNGAAIRHYVSLGIITEKRTVTANTLDDRIIKSAQKEVVIETLLPLKTSIDKLIDAMRNFDKKQDAHFLDATKQNQIFSRRLEALFDLAEKNFQTLTDDAFRAAVFAEEALRNLVIVRSILYVFLLGYKTGKIEPHEKLDWESIVRLAHRKAHELSYAELERLTAGAGTESPHIEKLAADIFLAVRDTRRPK